MTYQNGDEYDGYFEEGMKSGFGIMITKNGDKYGDYSLSRETSRCHYFYLKSDIINFRYVGRWDDDKKSGFGKEYIKSKNELFQGEFDSNFRNGQGRLITGKLEVFDGQFRRNELEYPTTTNKFIKMSTYEKMVHSFMKKRDKLTPH